MTTQHHVLILGSGLVCPPIVHYLTQHEFRITLASRTLSKANDIITSLPQASQALVTGIEYNVETDDENCTRLRELLTPCELAVSLLPYIYHVRAAKVALSLKKNFFTTSYVSPEMQALDEEVRAAGLLFLNECGVDPGLDHMSAQRMIDSLHARGGKVVGFSSICGGLPAPAANNNPLGYKLSWSPRGVLLASRNPATYFDKGERKVLVGSGLYEEGGYGTHTIDSGRGDVGTLNLEWYPNRDSTTYKAIYGIPETHSLVRGTYRNSGWCPMMKVVSRLGFTSTEVSEADQLWRHTHHAKLGPSGTCSLAAYTYSLLTKSDATQMPANTDVKQTLIATLKASNTSSAEIENVVQRLEFLGLFRHDAFVPSYDRVPTSLDVLCGVFEEHLQYAEGEQDMIVMQHLFEVEFDDKRSHRELWSSTLIDIGLQPSGYSSMARTVTIPVAIAIRGFCENRVSSNVRGVQRPVMPELYNLILDEMEKDHNVKFIEKLCPTQFWIRSETKPGEHRVPVSPADCKALLATGAIISVERSPHRCFDDDDYEAVGCQLVTQDSWKTAPSTAYIVGLKELPENDNTPLLHRHIYFAHCYKLQKGWQETLGRFVAPVPTDPSGPVGHKGHGLLYDLEFLNDSQGRRVAAFGRAAGLVGMALGLLQWSNQRTGNKLATPLQPWSSIDAMLTSIRDALRAVPNGVSPRVIVLGALGRCGSGSTWVCSEAGVTPTSWDIQETRGGGPFPALLEYDILVNCIYLSPDQPIAPFLTKDLLAKDSRQLSVIVDVSCDTSNPANPLPIYSEGTTLFNPITSVNNVDVIAIDHLPALIPRESSIDFSSALSPHVQALIDSQHPSSYVWNNAEALFDEKIKALA